MVCKGILKVLLGIKASSNCIRHIAVTIRQVAVIYCYGTSVVRNLKFLISFFIFLIIRITTLYYLRTVAM